MKVVTNPNKQLVEEIRKKIKENNGYCACAISFNDDTRCMCTNFKDKINRGELGECHCGLYCIIND